jgi:hypothetical protein
MTTDTPENISDTPEIDLDWENRRLCSDDSCIGVIGADGRCRVCGLLDTKTPPGSNPSNRMSTDQKESLESFTEDQATESNDPGWEDRKLCLDESCVGAIGADGRCNVCGLSG